MYLCYDDTGNRFDEQEGIQCYVKTANAQRQPRMATVPRATLIGTLPVNIDRRTCLRYRRHGHAQTANERQAIQIGVACAVDAMTIRSAPTNQGHLTLLLALRRKTELRKALAKGKLDPDREGIPQHQREWEKEELRKIQERKEQRQKK
jgi:hypothetical protein